MARKMSYEKQIGKANKSPLAWLFAFIFILGGFGGMFVAAGSLDNINDTPLVLFGISATLAMIGIAITISSQIYAIQRYARISCELLEKMRIQTNTSRSEEA